MGLFQRLLEQHERERHTRIARGAPGPHPRDTEDAGFVSVAAAAAEMGCDEQEVLRMARHGELEWCDGGGEVLVLPAIVSKMGVRTAG